MKQTIISYGIKSAIAIVVLFLAGWTLGKNLDFSTQEVIGYASMIVSLSFVYFGIKHFRDQVNNGALTFKKALAIGLLISLFAAVAFAILDVIYVTFINPDFTQAYYEYTLEGMRKTLSPEEFETQKKLIESQMELFASPAISGIIMFATVMIIGLAISLLSALLLQRKSS